VAAYLLLRERLSRVQLTGVTAIVVGVAVLGGLRA
jgi:drug/metabolite transporter (DMT)-like permease